jgi:ribosomal protein L40E
MEAICHRCSATIEPDAQYCPNCGAPQIRYVPQEEAAAPVAVPAKHSASVVFGGIAWPVAIRISLIVALVTGALTTLLAPGSILWVTGGAFLAIRLYARRTPQHPLPRRSGIRIGGLVGLLTAAVALTGNSIFLVIQRFALHQGSVIDTQLTSIVTQAAARASTMDPQAPVSMLTSFWLSPEGRTGLILLTMAFLSVLILLFAIAGGVFAAQMTRSRTGSTTL